MQARLKRSPSIIQEELMDDFHSQAIKYNLIPYTSEGIKHLHLTRLQLSIIQTEKLRAIIQFAQTHSEWYRDKIGHLDPQKISLSNFHDHIPILTKKELVNNWNQICTDKELKKEDIEAFIQSEEKNIDSSYLYQGKYHIISTSGSSGYAGIFAYNDDEWSRYCSQFTRLIGYKKMSFKKVAELTVKSNLFAAPRSISTIIPSHLEHKRFNYLDSTKECNLILNQMMPDLVMTLPSILKKLCFEKESGRLLIEPKTIRVSAEPLNTSLRSRCEKIFPDSTVENTYAGSEGFSAFNCSKNKNKLHLSEDFGLFEIYRDKGLVFTNLWQKTLPLIRYQIDDNLIEINEHRCPDCGLYFKSIEEPQGRLSNDFEFANGSKITALELTEIMNHYPFLPEYQIIQSKDGFTVLIECSNDHRLIELRHSLNRLALKKELSPERICIKICAKIERQKSGKIKQYVPLGLTK